MIRRGMTLVEMLVAMTATLLIMAAVAQAFSAFGNAISGGRSILELDSRMRAVAWTLRSDLAGATARPLPPLNPASAEGYLEIIEGPATDYVDTLLATTVGSSVSGDHDDVLLLTTRSLDAPFVGRAPGTDSAYESTVAEVGWFARPTSGASNPIMLAPLQRYEHGTDSVAIQWSPSKQVIHDHLLSSARQMDHGRACRAPACGYERTIHAHLRSCADTSTALTRWPSSGSSSPPTRACGTRQRRSWACRGPRTPGPISSASWRGCSSRHRRQ